MQTKPVSAELGRKTVAKKLRGIRFLPKDATYDEMDSPVGRLTIITSGDGLHAILWDTDRKALKSETIIRSLTRAKDEKTIVRTKIQLDEYFKGTRKIFDLPLVMDGTNFQVQAWQQLLQIPYATTISYAKQAEKMGSRNKARAVGMANGLNPISIVIPCHRVIGSNGNLVGFAGGIDKKNYLLKLEMGNIYEII